MNGASQVQAERAAERGALPAPMATAVAWAPRNRYNHEQAERGFSRRRYVDETVDHRCSDRTIWITPGQHRLSGMTDQVSDELSTAVRPIRQRSLR